MNEIKVVYLEDIPTDYTGVAEFPDDTKVWYVNGKLHRTGGPALEYYNGDKRWYLNGKLHREDGPALEYADGTKRWFLDGTCYYSSVFSFKDSIIIDSYIGKYDLTWYRIMWTDGQFYTMPLIPGAYIL